MSWPRPPQARKQAWASSWLLKSGQLRMSPRSQGQRATGAGWRWATVGRGMSVDMGRVGLAVGCDVGVLGGRVRVAWGGRVAVLVGWAVGELVAGRVVVASAGWVAIWMGDDVGELVGTLRVAARVAARVEVDVGRGDAGSGRAM